MSWTDRKSIDHIKQLRDIFKVKTFVETGTFKGINVITHLPNFDMVYSCESDEENYDYARKKIQDYWINKTEGNPYIYNQTSKEFLKFFKKFYKEAKRKDTIIFYLDAHFYDPKNNKSNKDRFVVLQELKALKGFKNCIIIIHDFDNNLGHITYDGISLDFKLLEKDLNKVNPNFKFYTNELSSCDIVRPYETDDPDERANLEYAWSKPEKTFRGILYCVPKKINIKGLKEWN
ncbi:MAG: hypothetical protein IIA87_03505 [Nanoarchaeota archaeon]|nr:hypothetical protein [Nanoarchaeota archaeon]